MSRRYKRKKQSNHGKKTGAEDYWYLSAGMIVSAGRARFWLSVFG